jgi:hypothetical protein
MGLITFAADFARENPLVVTALSFCAGLGVHYLGDVYIVEPGKGKREERRRAREADLKHREAKRISAKGSEPANRMYRMRTQIRRGRVVKV